jgi:hypothetical protein
MLELQDTLCLWIWQRVLQPSLLPHVRTARLPHAVAHSASHLPPCAVQAAASSDLKGACIARCEWQHVRRMQEQSLAWFQERHPMGGASQPRPLSMATAVATAVKTSSATIAARRLYDCGSWGLKEGGGLRASAAWERRIQIVSHWNVSH